MPSPAWFIRFSAETPRAKAAFSASRICAEVTTGEFTVPRSLLSFPEYWRFFSGSWFCGGGVLGPICARNAGWGKAANQRRRGVIDLCKKGERGGGGGWERPGGVSGRGFWRGWRGERISARAGL